jgi:hypothetical protein
MTSTANSPPAEYFMDSKDEIKRLSYNHEIIKAGMDNKLILAPIDLSLSLVTILDSATADGKFHFIFSPTAFSS